MSSTDNEDDPSFVALSVRLRRRIDDAFDSITSLGMQSHPEIPAQGFIVEELESGPSQYEAGGFIIEDPLSRAPGVQLQIPLSEIPHGLRLLGLTPDDDIMGVFKNATTGWGVRNTHNDGVSRKDWRAVCAALLEGEHVDGSDEESLVGGEDIDSGPDSDEFQMEEGLPSDTEETSSEYGEPSSPTKAKKAQKVSSRSFTKDSRTEISRQLTESEKAQCRQEFSRFFPHVPENELDRQRITIKDIVRVAGLLKENLETEEILDMLEAFSTSPDKSMNLADFEYMMILTKLVQGC